MAKRLRLQERVATRISELREAQGLTQADLARLLGTSRGQVSKVESGERAITLPTLESVAQALGVDVGALVQNDVKATNKPDRADKIARELRSRGAAHVAAVEAFLKILDRVEKAK